MFFMSRRGMQVLASERAESTCQLGKKQTTMKKNELVGGTEE